MPFGSNEQQKVLNDRVFPRISDQHGHLEDDSADLDARAMLLMGKRQQLKVKTRQQSQISCEHGSDGSQRSFGFVSIASFSTTVLASWQAFAWLVKTPSNAAPNPRTFGIDIHLYTVLFKEVLLTVALPHLYMVSCWPSPDLLQQPCLWQSLRPCKLQACYYAEEG